MKEQIFTIQQKEKTDTPKGMQYTYLATVIPSSKIFEGHFPQTPVVPGVCSLEMLKQCCADALGENLRYTHIKECKYLQVILPTHETLAVEINLNRMEEAPQSFQLIAEVLHEGQKMMKVKAIIQEQKKIG